MKSAQISSFHVNINRDIAYQKTHPDIILCSSAYHSFFHLDYIRVSSHAACANECITDGWNQNGKKKTVVCTAAVDDVTSCIFRWAIFLSLLDVETWHLNRSYYFSLICKLTSSKLEFLTSATYPLHWCGMNGSGRQSLQQSRKPEVRKCMRLWIVGVLFEKRIGSGTSAVAIQEQLMSAFFHNLNL